MTVPPEALAAAAEACPFVNRDALQRALEAAAPHMRTSTFTDGFIDGVATEKANIIHLATQMLASIPADHPHGARASFADYLRTVDVP